MSENKRTSILEANEFYTKYSPIGMIGNGKFGQVFLIQHKNTENYFAVKIIPVTNVNFDIEHNIEDLMLLVELGRVAKDNLASPLLNPLLRRAKERYIKWLKT